MDYAASPFEIKNMNDSGAIEGLLAGFSNIDSHGDRISPSAFRRTLAERNGRPLPMLLHHDMRRPIGGWHEWEERKEGLYVKGAMAMKAPDAQEAHALAKTGALGALSIGFNLKAATDHRDGTRDVHDVDLLEGSLVTIGSNPKTLVAVVKSIGGARDIEDMLRETGLSGRKAKHAAGAAWKAINDTNDEAESDEAVRAILNASAKRIAAIGKAKR